MSFNGTGTFNRIYSWLTDQAAGILVRADRMDADTNDIASGLSNCMTRDGQSPPTASIPMGAQKLTGLANGTSAQDATTVLQVFTSPTFAGMTITGTADLSGATEVKIPTGTNSSDAVRYDQLLGTAFNSALPSQTGNSGKFVTTNGTAASWVVPTIVGASNTIAQFNTACSDADFQAALVSGTTIKTINSVSLLGSGNIISSSLVCSSRSSNAILTAADNATLIQYTSGTFTQTYTVAATLGNGWFCYLQNLGTGVITHDPNASETIGGVTTAAQNTGDIWLVVCDGSNFQLQRLDGSGSQIYTTGSGNFTVPAGVYRIFAKLWGAGGGGGGGGSTLGGGGGGGYTEGWMSTTPNATIAYAVGAGAHNSTGGSTTLGTWTASGGAASGVGGTGSGGSFNVSGGSPAEFSSSASAMGGAAFGTPVCANQVTGNAPGGGCGVFNNGFGTGARGEIQITWV